MIDSPGSVRSHAEGASIVQVETLGKGGAIILWASAFLSALAIAMAIFAMIVSNNASEEARLMQYEFTIMRPRLNALGVTTEDPITHEEQ
jgi:hypothetical protein